MPSSRLSPMTSPSEQERRRRGQREPEGDRERERERGRAHRRHSPLRNRSAPVRRRRSPPAQRTRSPPAQRTKCPPAQRTRSSPANRTRSPPVNRACSPFAHRTRSRSPPAHRRPSSPAHGTRGRSPAGHGTRRPSPAGHRRPSPAAACSPRRSPSRSPSRGSREQAPPLVPVLLRHHTCLPGKTSEEWVLIGQDVFVSGISKEWTATKLEALFKSVGINGTLRCCAVRCCAMLQLCSALLRCLHCMLSPRRASPAHLHSPPCLLCPKTSHLLPCLRFPPVQCSTQTCARATGEATLPMSLLHLRRRQPRLWIGCRGTT
jgi:hypothetical protein